MTQPAEAGSIQAPEGARRIEPAAVGGARVAIVAAEYHTDIVQELVNGAVAELREHGVEVIDVVPVPGAFEIGLAAQRCAERGYDAVIAHGCVIRGDTPHFDYVCQAAMAGVGEASRATGVPIAFGVLTVETHQQALDRIGGSEGHKGREAAAAALGLLGTVRALG